ncbi:DNA polymerase III subunit delta' [Prochlorococcus sp. MIT 1300]|uniref:DNA polymerase III subunit delta' n=1 Tax=Prochlorococcus sp. MIT 1300 TaxID=3096218 RepID=UPI002A75DBB4|nr:DNA polymerase III subunit delta' [Prochlorococcus sp. MIT 1300]
MPLNRTFCATSLFEDIIGQPLAISLLTASLEKNHIAPAYLFSGPDGIGRKLCALRFLEGLLTNGQISIRERKRLEDSNHPDVLWIEPTYQHQGKLIPASKAKEEGINLRSNLKLRIEQIKQIPHFLAQEPIEAKKGMVILEGVENIDEPAANALLKTLEEPGKGILILLSTRPECLLQTIKSRCQEIPFFRLRKDSLRQVLKKSKKPQEEALDLEDIQPEIILLANGSPGALIDHKSKLEEIPQEIWSKLNVPNASHIEALNLAKEISTKLDNSQQIWMIDWLQQHLWNKNFNPQQIKKLQILRRHLINYVQPRLAWEIALIELIERTKH